MNKKITHCVLKKMKKRGEKIAAITSYDYLSTRLVDSAGIDMILEVFYQAKHFFRMTVSGLKQDLGILMLINASAHRKGDIEIFRNAPHQLRQGFSLFMRSRYIQIYQLISTFPGI